MKGKERGKGKERRKEMRKALNKKMPDKVPHGEVMIDDSLVGRITGVRMPYARANNSLTSAVPVENALTAHLACEKYGRRRQNK